MRREAWSEYRVAQVEDLKRLVREVLAINNGSHCLERIKRCIDIAYELDSTCYDPVRQSFMQFIEHQAVEGLKLVSEPRNVNAEAK